MTIQPMTSAEKALQLNLDRTRYGTLAEIGAGQEVARWFFHVGGAAGTVAKSVSAYDMAVSDGMYGPSPRYVSQERLQQMLDREYASVVDTLRGRRGDTTSFFAFADTVATRSYQRREDGVGWLGIAFQHRPHAEPSQIRLHVRLLDPETTLQQEAVGLLGVNLIHAASFLHGDVDALMASLGDHLTLERVEVDFVNVAGPVFARADPRRLNLGLVRNALARAVMFTPRGQPVEPSAILYKRPIAILRGAFRPVRGVDLDMLRAAGARIAGEGDALPVAELAPAGPQGADGIDPGDLLARVDTLAAVGVPCLVTGLAEFFHLVDYLGRYAPRQVMFVVSAQALAEFFRAHYFDDLEGGTFEALGRLFKRWVRVALYPALDPRTGLVVTASTAPVPPANRHLLQHLLENELILELDAPRDRALGDTADVLADLQAGGRAWETAVPPAVAALIKERRLFGYGG